MTSELAPHVHADRLAETFVGWLGNKSASSRQKYVEVLGYFARHVGAETPAAALTELLAMGRGRASAAIDVYKAALLAAGLSSSTVNLRLGTIASFVDAARRHGHVEWSLDVEMVKHEARKDNRGPEWSDYEAIVAAEPTARGRAIFRLMGDRGLRRAEVATLDLEHVTARGVAVLRKGRRERETLEINPRTREALAAWIAERGDAPGPLFGLAPEGVYKFVRRSVARAGFAGVHPHSFRHSFGTKVARESGGDAYLVKELMGHASITTSARYVDRSEERAAAMLGAIGGA